MSIGENIKKIRKEKGVTQEKLGELIGLKSITIRKYESNDREPNQETINKIADVLNIEPYQLITDKVKTLADYSTTELLEELLRRAKNE